MMADDAHDTSNLLHSRPHHLYSHDISPLRSQQDEHKRHHRRFIALVAVSIVILGALCLLLLGSIVGLTVYLTTRGGSGDSSCVRAANRYRLPRSVLPVEYDITLSPDLQTFTYTGVVDIALQVQERTTCVLLHAEDLDIASVKLQRTAASTTAGEDDKDWNLAEMELDKETAVLTLRFDKALETDDSYRLSMEFAAALRDDLRGFYKAKYYDSVSKRDIWIATTHMEPTSARTAFPCFDEPSFKARFNIQLDLSEADSANKKILSNMPMVSQITDRSGFDGEKRTRFTFEKTPIMSTYLIAFIIGEFDVIETTDRVSSDPESREITYRVYTPVNLGENGRFALDVATNVTRYFSDYFAIDYMLPKLDLIAIPDFRAGAMENYGLLTFRDSAILVNEETTTFAERQNVARTISHEIAHQWVGNLATCSYWSELWINEGFARFFENMAMEFFWKEWDNWTKFTTNMILPMMQVDAQHGTHSVVMPTNEVNTTQQISDLFDTITYAKGAAVLRMIKTNVGDDTFRTWMQQWLVQWQYSTGNTDDLFSLLRNITDRAELEDQLKTWTNNPGFPVVQVTASGNNGYTLSQQRFYNVRPSSNETEQALWWIPVTVVDSAGNEKSIAFVDTTSAEFSVTAGSKWIKVNRDETSIVRVNYEESMWHALIDAVGQGDPVLVDSLSDRVGLLSDAFALAEAGMTPISIALDLSVAIQKREQSFYVWSAMMGSISRVSEFVHFERFAGKYRQFVSDLIADSYATLGWEKDDAETSDMTQRRALVIQAGVQVAQNASIIRDAVAHFRETGTISAELRAPVYTAVMMSCDSDEEYEAMVERMVEADRQSDPSERNRIMLSLAWVRVPHLLQRTLDLVLTDKVRAQDGSSLIVTVGRSGPLGLSMAWDFLRERFDELVAKFGIRQVNSSLIKGVPARFVTRAHADEVVSFFADRPGVSQESVQAAVESIMANAKFLDDNSGTLQHWLDEHY